MKTEQGQGKHQVIGYRRVSSLEQNTARQLDGVDLDTVFEDKASGKDTNRPELLRMIQHTRQGDTVVVHSMDRLARSLMDLKSIVSELVAKGAQVRFIKENLSFSGTADPLAELTLNMMGAFAEFERSLIKARQAEGIAIAKAAGEYAGRGGRPTKIDAGQIATIKARVAAGEKKTAIAKDLGVSRESIYKHLKE